MLEIIIRKLYALFCGCSIELFFAQEGYDFKILCPLSFSKYTPKVILTKLLGSMFIWHAMAIVCTLKSVNNIFGRKWLL